MDVLALNVDEIYFAAIELESAEKRKSRGGAHYWSGDWKASIETLKTYIALEKSPDGRTVPQWFFWRWPIGNSADRVAARNQSNNQELRRLQV